MKSFLLGTALLALTAGAAAAADVTPMPETGWTGFYAGVIGGYSWGRADLDANIDLLNAGAPAPAPVPIQIPRSLSRSADINGGLIGGQIGYDFEVGNGFVLGAAGDIEWSGAESDKVCLERFGLDCGHQDSDHAEGYSSMDWLATVRARAGFAVGDALIYATGGVAFASLEVNVDNLNYKGDNYSDSDTRTGWTVGGGAEYKFTDHVSIGAEYLYVDLGEVDTKYEAGPAEINAKTDFTTNIVRASLNYRF